MWVLVVCRANVCRSRAASAMLAADLADLGARVGAAGTVAEPLADPCPAVLDFLDARRGRIPTPFRSPVGVSRVGPSPVGVVDHPRTNPDAGAELAASPLRDADPDASPVQLTEAMVRAADLILTSSREVSAGVSASSLESRSRTFTLRRAAAGALYVAGFLESGEIPPGAAALPPHDDVEGRWQWFLAELDASRGQAPLTPGPDPRGPDDLPDPHDGGVTHEVALAALAQACDDIAAGARAVLGAG